MVISKTFYEYFSELYRVETNKQNNKF